MKNQQWGCVTIALFLVAGCHRGSEPVSSIEPVWREGKSILVEHPGTNAIDREIRDCQARLRASEGAAGSIQLELGWLFVSKARRSLNPSFYTLAEQCARGVAKADPGNLEAMLLLGHSLQSMHRFSEAEALARQLVSRRGAPFDHGLLGDALMDQGRLTEAVGAYQEMVNLRPDLHSYARIAHLRWLKGSLSGAIEAMRLAVGASSPADPEPAAWVHTALAGYLFQANDLVESERLCDLALRLIPQYPAALLLRGRLYLAAGEAQEAVECLRTAANLTPLPQYLWTLADALGSAGRTAEAAQTQERLRRQGPHTDPRTCSLYMATKGVSPELALRLAREELEVRKDVFTEDALAWALASNERWVEAAEHLSRALSEGTQDARLYLHAALIAARSGQSGQARLWREKLMPLAHTLLPSERALLSERSSLASR